MLLMFYMFYVSVAYDSSVLMLLFLNYYPCFNVSNVIAFITFKHFLM